jgi:hypothetical protein
MADRGASMVSGGTVQTKSMIVATIKTKFITCVRLVRPEIDDDGQPVP